MSKRTGIVLTCLFVLIAPSVFASGTSETAGKATLQVVLNQTWNKPSFAPSIQEYEKANPNVTIDLQVIPDKQFTQLIKTRIATGQYPDVWLDNFGQIVQNYNVPDLLVDLDSQSWVNRLVSTSGVTVNGKLYGLPMNGTPSVEGIVYNKKIFQQLGLSIPTTYNELLSDCAKIKSSGIDPFVVTAKDIWTVGMWVVEIVPLAVMDRPGIWNELNTGKVKFDAVPAFNTVFERMKEIIVDKGYANKDMFSATYDMGNDMVAQGKAAMEVQGDWAAADIAKKYPNVEVGIFPFPIVDNPRFTAGFTPAFVIPKKSKNVAASEKLLDFFATAAEMKKIALDWGYVPAVKDVQVPLKPWIQNVVDNYILKGQTPINEMGVASMVDIGQLSTYTANMLDGTMKVSDLMPAWQKYFAEQAKIRKLPGWE